MKRFPSILSALLCALFVLTCSYPTALAYATETTGTTQAALLHNDSWFIPDSVTGLSLSEVNVLYNNFLATHTSKINEQNQPVDTISSFVQYAVDQHIISNTQEARKSLSVASMRVFLSGTATAAYIPLPMASTFLQHSLADYPSNLSYGSESSFAKKFLSLQKWQISFPLLNPKQQSNPLLAAGSVAIVPYRYPTVLICALPYVKSVIAMMFQELAPQKTGR